MKEFIVVQTDIGGKQRVFWLDSLEKATRKFNAIKDRTFEGSKRQPTYIFTCIKSTEENEHN